MAQPEQQAERPSVTLYDLITEGVPLNTPLYTAAVSPSEMLPPLSISANIGGKRGVALTAFCWGKHNATGVGREARGFSSPVAFALVNDGFAMVKLLDINDATPLDTSVYFSAPLEYNIANDRYLYATRHDYLYATRVELFYNQSIIQQLEALYPRSDANIFVVPRRTANALLLRNYTEDVPINLAKFSALTNLLNVGFTQCKRYMNPLEYYYHFLLYTRLVGHCVVKFPKLKNFQPLVQHHDAPCYSNVTCGIPAIDASLFPKFDYRADTPCYGVQY